ncbi:MAG: hypothetical protein ACO3IN_10995, partial [Steroidobacteraceae bacterium]
MYKTLLSSVFLTALASPICAADAPATEFLTSIAAMCGNAYGGCSCRFMSATTAHAPGCSPSKAI